MTKKTPMILHTDLGTDIDDSWALIMLLRQNLAIHPASTTKYLKMEDMRMSVDDKGMLTEDPSAPVIHYALEWTDLPGYKDFLGKTLLGKA